MVFFPSWEKITKKRGKVEMHEWMHVVDRSMVLKENLPLLHLKLKPSGSLEDGDSFFGSLSFFSFQPFVFGAVRALNETIFRKVKSPPTSKSWLFCPPPWHCKGRRLAFHYACFVKLLKPSFFSRR